MYNSVSQYKSLIEDARLQSKVKNQEMKTEASSSTATTSSGRTNGFMTFPQRFTLASKTPKDLVVLKPPLSKLNPQANSYLNRLKKTPIANDEVRLEHQIRLAIHEGEGCTNAKRNPKLKKVLEQAVQNKVPLATIDGLMKKFNAVSRLKNGRSYHLLQIRYQQKIFIICAVETDAIGDLRRRLSPILKRFEANYGYAMHKFRHNTTIEALCSLDTTVDFSDWERSIEMDAIACKASSIEVVDYETGAINFKCGPLEIAEVSNNLEQKGYRILHTDFGFKPKVAIQLTQRERAGYERFLARLWRLSEVEEIFDNVATKTNDTVKPSPAAPKSKK